MTAPEERRAGPLPAVTGALTAAAPHLLHHAGLIAGTAVLSGVLGGVVFGLLGLAAMTPLLLRLHRRTGSWRLPALALGAFAVMFGVTTAFMGTM
jgi:hypothetical protein